MVPYRSISGQVAYLGDNEDACITMYVHLFVSGFCSDVAQVEGIAKMSTVDWLSSRHQSMLILLLDCWPRTLDEYTAFSTPLWFSALDFWCLLDGASTMSPLLQRMMSGMSSYAPVLSQYRSACSADSLPLSLVGVPFFWVCFFSASCFAFHLL